MAQGRRPDIVVGIDVGQTCSGVAYSIGPDWSAPYTLNKWPSYDGYIKADKVATRVGYGMNNNGSQPPQQWGFECVFGDANLNVREQFKLTLDYEYEDDRGFQCDEARRWYRDYLRCLYNQIRTFFNERIPNWQDLHIEYSFSTPTTWRDPAMIAKIEELIKEAGFVSGGRQTVRMGLTEAEAAAIDAATTQYRKGDVFLICDAGGGTTDVNVLSVKTVGEKVELEPLDHVEGVPIGSTLIDYRMTEHIVQRLERIKQHLEGDPLFLAEEMLMGKFQTIKHSFPKPIVDQFWLDVKGLAGAQSFPEADIVDSKMAINKMTLKNFFDQQITQIFELIDDRLWNLQKEFPSQQVAYIILSGGLGSSDYLHDQLRKRYEMNQGFSSMNTASIRIMKALEPQLTVVKGLVRERTQQLGVTQQQGQEVFKRRRCRNSYGLAVRQLYNESVHGNIPTKLDARDGKVWVENLIDWFVMQGEEVDPDNGIRRGYGATLTEEEKSKPRNARIIMSNRPRHQLPLRTTDPGCKEVALVKYNLTSNDMKLKKQQLWKFSKKKYWRAAFYFVVKFGPADLRFQIVGENGILSTDHEGLTIDFMDASDKAPNGALRHSSARYA